jgi:predicted ArsR family transcriptional regulator
MNTTNTATKKERVLEALQNTNRGLTEAQIATRFDVGNVSATISSLRMDGYAIYANKHTDTKGRTKTFYRLSTPSRAVVAAGYRAIAAGWVDLPV